MSAEPQAQGGPEIENLLAERRTFPPDPAFAAQANATAALYEAAEADYDLAGRTLTLSGDVLLTQGTGALSAERMVVDLATGTARLEGRVRTVLGAQP